MNFIRSGNPGINLVLLENLKSRSGSLCDCFRLKVSEYENLLASGISWNFLEFDHEKAMQNVSLFKLENTRPIKPSVIARRVISCDKV